MKPEDWRKLLIRPGTPLGLLGEELGPGLVKGTLTSHIVVECHPSMCIEQEAGAWDTAVIMTLFTPLQVKTIDAKEYSGNTLLVIHRYPGFAWDNGDPTVLVFGIREGEPLGDGPAACDIWQSRAVWLESHAIMTVEDPSAPSEVSLLMRRRSGHS